MSYFRKNIQRMAAYVPGEQPAPGSKVIKLNTNENPYPPSPKAIRALRTLDADFLRRYPHPYALEFRQAAAEALGVKPEWVIAGNGSDDLLAMIVLACAEKGRKVVYPMPTYVLYRTLAEMQDARCVEVPFDDDYNLPLEGLAKANGAVTFIASPNSPSGTVVPGRQLDELARRLSGVLVIDEAYTDFANENALALVKKRPNVIVLRTLSKGYSLAGLRLGFGVMQPALAEGIIKVKDSYPVDAAACAVGAAAMRDQAYKERCAAKVKAARAKLARDLERLGFRVWPSQSNFLLAQVPARTAAAGRRTYEALKARGILVRYFNEPRLDDKLRITVGTAVQNAALVSVLTNDKINNSPQRAQRTQS
jgi:histidinol-phosphate aminotransferase